MVDAVLFFRRFFSPGKMDAKFQRSSRVNAVSWSIAELSNVFLNIGAGIRELQGNLSDKVSLTGSREADVKKFKV